MIRILRDFKPILDPNLYGDHMPEERITGSKIDLDLSARSTYTRVYTVVMEVGRFHVIFLLKDLDVFFVVK